MEKSKIEDLVNQCLVQNEKLFLVSVSIDASSHISVEIDGDEGVSINDCVKVNRFIESVLDADELIYSLNVSSPDIAKPLLLQRQYLKNIGRTLQLETTLGDKYEAVLDEVTEEGVVLFWNVREDKEIGKGKVTVEKQVFIPFQDIKEAKVKILFN